MYQEQRESVYGCGRVIPGERKKIYSAGPGRGRHPGRCDQERTRKCLLHTVILLNVGIRAFLFLHTRYVLNHGIIGGRTVESELTFIILFQLGVYLEVVKSHQSTKVSTQVICLNFF